jgi:hypothetical protein
MDQKLFEKSTPGEVQPELLVASSMIKYVTIMAD